MKFFCISDNTDTCMGMRLAGIEGVVVHEREEVEAALSAAIGNNDIGVILITAKAGELCREQIDAHKLGRAAPLILEVMDRHMQGQVSDSLTRYVRESVGIRI